MHLKHHISWQTSLVILYALILALARTILHTHNSDIGFDDESGYLRAGLQFFHASLPSAENSPLYALWYWFEACIVSDPVTLYQANWGILLTLALILLTFALRAAGVSIVGTMLALTCASIAYYWDIWPYVTILSGALVLLAATLMLRSRKPSRAYSTVAVVFAIGVFVRPELLTSFLIILAVAAYYSRRERASASIITPIVVFISLCLIFGAPFGNGRSMAAFSQHFAVNIVQANQNDIDPWNNTNQIIKANFGKVSTVLQAVEARPRAFLWHLTKNAKTLMDNADLWHLTKNDNRFTGNSDVVLSPVSSSLDNASVIRLNDTSSIILFEVIKTSFEILLIVGLILGLYHARKDEKGRRLIIMLFALLVPFFISVLVIYPRLHYFMAPLAILFVLAGYGWSRTLFKLSVWSLSIAPVPFILLALAWNEAPYLPNFATIQFLKTLVLPPNGTILESDYGRALYANLNYVRISQTQCNPFLECLQSQRPTVIVSDGRLVNYYAKDAGFHSATPREFGYVVKEVPDTGIFILYTPVSRQY